VRAESDLRTFVTALILAVVCSFLVSGAAVMLKPKQEKNKELDRKRNVLAAGGLLNNDTDVEKAFEAIETVFADIKSGRAVSGDIDEYFDNFKKLSTGASAIDLTKDQDVAGIKSIPAQVPVFILKKEGELDKVILPVYGSGLWSTLYGFLALESDLNTVSGITFYEHAETPGLGGEVDNPRWKDSWVDKKIYNQDGNVAFRLVKGGAKGVHEVDSLSGASLTSIGVENIIKFWLGENGFESFLDNLREGGA
jgi:Na+-transporting NADH:ubiquinone oxidoreductase subunit C